MLASHSLDEAALRAHLGLYRAVMFGESGLSRAEREAVAPLREVGLSDRDIVDLNQVVSYFNYVNRVADGLGVELEEGG